MRLTALLRLPRPGKHANLPDYHKVWEVKYRGPSLPKNKVKDVPIWPVPKFRVLALRRALAREFQVMTCLATPYLNQEEEEPWIRQRGSLEEDRNREEEEKELARMPSKPKVVTGRQKYDQLRGNVGNLLHRPWTLEDDLAHILPQNRWD